MSSPGTAFYQTLAAAFSQANATLVGPTKVLETVYIDYRPEVLNDIGQTLNIPLPASATNSVADVGTGDFVFTVPSAATVPVVINQHPAYAFVINDFDRFNTPADIRTVFLDSALKGILEYVNRDIASLFTTANFNAYAAITGTAGEVVEADMAKAWGTLATNKIPVRDLGNLFLTVAPTVYANMSGDTYWTANSQVGFQIAGEIRRSGFLGTQWGAIVDFDMDMPKSTSGSPVVTAYTDALYHRHAIALVTRPLPTPDTSVVEPMILMLKGILPIRLMVGYNQLKGGWVTTVDCGYGRAVVRPDHGIIIDN